MTYKDFQFKTNPEKIEIEFSKNIVENKIIGTSSLVSQISTNAKIVKGSGKIFGADYILESEKLKNLQSSEEKGWLFLPNCEPMLAYFKELVVKYDAKNSCAQYDFVFVESPKNESSKYDFGFTFVLQNENLFDVANRTDVEIEKIMELNNFITPFDVSIGDKVVLS